MRNTDIDRRDLLRAAVVAGAGVAFVSTALAESSAEEHMGALGHGGDDGYVVSASLTQHCATCDNWGGQRRISADGTTITVTGLGWCNNRESRNFRRMTSPDHGPMKVWRKWGVLN
ncbi:MAG: hypothetical protein IPK07_03185 [Deltaproteobacteria bacterium]|nr:hypothetical protein [Deltaproteobacteria bacterium]